MTDGGGVGGRRGAGRGVGVQVLHTTEDELYTGLVMVHGQFVMVSVVASVTV